MTCGMIEDLDLPVRVHLKSLKLEVCAGVLVDSKV
jgi:hypothetical protein